jgi:hypothetical protein
MHVWRLLGDYLAVNVTGTEDVCEPRRDGVIPRRHYVLVGLEQILPAWQKRFIAGDTGRP